MKFNIDCTKQTWMTVTDQNQGWFAGYLNDDNPPIDFGWHGSPLSRWLPENRLRCGCNNVTVWTY